jgi:hypothetical protein
VVSKDSRANFTVRASKIVSDNIKISLKKRKIGILTFPFGTNSGDQRAIYHLFFRQSYQILTLAKIAAQTGQAFEGGGAAVQFGDVAQYGHKMVPMPVRRVCYNTQVISRLSGIEPF